MPKHSFFSMRRTIAILTHGKRGCIEICVSMQPLDKDNPLFVFYTLFGVFPICFRTAHGADH